MPAVVVVELPGIAEPHIEFAAVLERIVPLLPASCRVTAAIGTTAAAVVAALNAPLPAAAPPPDPTPPAGTGSAADDDTSPPPAGV